MVALIVGGVFGWRWLKRLWDQAKQGAMIVSDRRAYVRWVLLPQVLSWCCKVAVVGVLLAAYGIPVGFRVGVNQALNAASLHEATNAATAPTRSGSSC